MKLSGWARLWIVCTLLLWAIGVWSAVEAWGFPPDPNVSDSTACNLIWVHADYDPNSPWARCLEEPSMIRAAHETHESVVNDYPGRMIRHFVPWFFSPLLLAVVWLIGRWIFRGFHAQSG